MKVLQPPGWPRPRGYANGISARGRMIFVAGMVGWNADGQFVTDDLVGQIRQALLNIVAVLVKGQAGPQHIARMTWYVTDKHAYQAASAEIGRVFRDIIGHYEMAMTAIEVASLMEDRAKVEIEVTAVVPD
jgi:enamine deaminase RidA (YjgF/YER057c/UK114 family)